MDIVCPPNFFTSLGASDTVMTCYVRTKLNVGQAAPAEWPFNDEAAMDKIERGFQQLDNGEGVYLGSFAEFAVED